MSQELVVLTYPPSTLPGSVLQGRIAPREHPPGLPAGLQQHGSTGPQRAGRGGSAAGYREQGESGSHAHGLFHNIKLDIQLLSEIYI